MSKDYNKMYDNLAKKEKELLRGLKNVRINMDRLKPMGKSKLEKMVEDKRNSCNGNCSDCWLVDLCLDTPRLFDMFTNDEIIAELNKES